jgi:hypothetical protein
MPGQITVTFRGFTDQNFAANLPRSVKVSVPSRSTPGPIEETLIKSSLEGVAMVSSRRAPTIRSLLALMAPPPAVMRILGAVGSIPIRRTRDFTITAGFTASAGAVASVGAGAGIYFWNKTPSGEVGLYGSLSVGLISNIGAGAGDAFAYLFDKAPTVLAGDIIALEVSVEIGPVSVAGQLFMTAPPVSLWPPALTGPWVPEIVGVGFTVTAGVSALPVSIAVTPSRTWILPITP